MTMILVLLKMLFILGSRHGRKKIEEKEKKEKKRNSHTYIKFIIIKIKANHKQDFNAMIFF